MADEVRKLAERTAKATKEIDEIIKGLQQKSSSALDAMENASIEIEKGSQLSKESLEILEKIAMRI